MLSLLFFLSPLRGQHQLRDNHNSVVAGSESWSQNKYFKTSSCGKSKRRGCQTKLPETFPSTNNLNHIWFLYKSTHGLFCYYISFFFASQTFKGRNLFLTWSSFTMCTAAERVQLCTFIDCPVYQKTEWYFFLNIVTHKIPKCLGCGGKASACITNTYYQNITCSRPDTLVHYYICEPPQYNVI